MMKNKMEKPIHIRGESPGFHVKFNFIQNLEVAATGMKEQNLWHLKTSSTAFF